MRRESWNSDREERGEQGERRRAKGGSDDEFEIQKQQLPRRRRCGLLSRRDLGFGTEAVHLRSTNLSIVSRQISRNITNIFRYRTPRIPFCSVEARRVLDYLNMT